MLPDPARPANPAEEVPADAYVYRDTSGQPDDPAIAAQPDVNDRAYWYDLPMTGSGSSGRSGADSPHVPEKTRGPFEPLVSSADPPGTAPRRSTRPDAAEPAASAPDDAHRDEAPAMGDDAREDAAHARKLEQIKDLYLTAEAIGEANIDKHFDQLLAQQRELIGDYFKQSSTARPTNGSAEASGASAPATGSAAASAASEPGTGATATATAAGQTETGPEGPGQAGDAGPADGSVAAPENSPVIADQPGAW